MRYLIITAAVLSIGLGQARAANVSAQANSGLDALSDCRLGDGLRLIEIKQRDNNATSRKVETAQGWRNISVADGYRLLYAYPGSDIFANVKAEVSADGQFERDSQTVQDGMEYLSERAGKTGNALEAVSINGLRALALNNPDLKGASLAMYSVFEPKKALTLTAYFFNHKPEQRQFQSREEFDRLKMNFLERLSTCAQSIKD